MDIPAEDGLWTNVGDEALEPLSASLSVPSANFRIGAQLDALSLYQAD